MTSYSDRFRKALVRDIESLKDEDIQNQLFQVLIEDNVSSITIENGFASFDLSESSDKTIGKINRFIKKMLAQQQEEIEEERTKYRKKVRSKEVESCKLNNMEKTILKQVSLNKIKGDQIEYDDYEDFGSKSKKKQKVAANKY